MQAQKTDGARGPGKSNAVADSESCGTRLRGSGEAGRKSDRPGHWSDQGEGQGWSEESGLQFGSILRVGWDMSVPSTSGEQKYSLRLTECGQNQWRNGFYKMNDRFFCLSFWVISIQRVSIS